MDYTARYVSPLGGIMLASDGEALIGLWFDGQKRFGASLGREHTERALPIFGEAARWLDAYFDGAAPTFTPRLAPRGTAFQRAVWDVLLTVPYGHTISYGEIADRLACRSAQAVGGAVGRNPISLIIPCHRVTGADGSLTGYAGGIDRKRSLLLQEQTAKTV